MRELFEKIVCTVFKFLTCVLWAAVMSIATAALLVPMAYEYRGYYAYGGEYVAVIGVFIVTYRLMYFWLNRRDKKEPMEKSEVYETNGEKLGA